jgi:hypothetical protein
MIEYAKTHLFYLALIASGLIFFHCWTQEHDQRLLAEQTVKAAQTQVQTLQAQIASEQAQAAATIASIQAKVISVKTPQQAVAAIPDLSSLPLNARPAVDNPTQVSVDAVPLAQTLGQCSEDKVALLSCQQEQGQKDQIISEQKIEIVALKKKPSFLRRVLGTAKAVGIGIGIGVLLVHAL